jgi:hypothetical protein
VVSLDDVVVVAGYRACVRANALDTTEMVTETLKKNHIKKCKMEKKEGEKEKNARHAPQAVCCSWPSLPRFTRALDRHTERRAPLELRAMRQTLLSVKHL